MKVRSLSGKRIIEDGIAVTLIDGDGQAILSNHRDELLAVPKREVNRIVEDIRIRTAKGELNSEAESRALTDALNELWKKQSNE
jgi:hypothetical protein